MEGFSVRAQHSHLLFKHNLMPSDVGISESTPLPFPLLPVSSSQLPFEAAYQKQNRHTGYLEPN